MPAPLLAHLTLLGFIGSFLSLLFGSRQSLAAPLLTRSMLAERTGVTLAVLQFAGILGHLESQFYAQVLNTFTPAQLTEAGYVSSQLVIELLNSIATDEAAHVLLIDSAIASLGALPSGQQCIFDFSPALTDVRTAIDTARVLELVGVNAYLGGATLLVSDVNALSAAGQVLSIEGRHSSLLNSLAGGSFQGNPFDTSLTPAAVLSLAGGFVKGGCDVVAATGITPLAALEVTFDPPVLASGVKLSFTSVGKPLPEAATVCQMIVGGRPIALAFPLDDCAVPEGVIGPVFIYVTSDANPLQANINQQDVSTVVAGPTLVFVDPLVPELLAQSLQNFPATLSTKAAAVAQGVDAPPDIDDPLFFSAGAEADFSGESTHPHRV